jgi:hypothetical protein
MGLEAGQLRGAPRNGFEAEFIALPFSKTDQDPDTAPTNKQCPQRACSDPARNFLRVVERRRADMTGHDAAYSSQFVAKFAVWSLRSDALTEKLGYRLGGSVAGPFLEASVR